MSFRTSGGASVQGRGGNLIVLRSGGVSSKDKHSPLIAAEAVTLQRQSNQRRTRHRKCLFARRPLPRKIKQNPRLQIFVPGYPAA